MGIFFLEFILNVGGVHFRSSGEQISAVAEIHSFSSRVWESFGTKSVHVSCIQIRYIGMAVPHVVKVIAAIYGIISRIVFV